MQTGLEIPKLVDTAHQNSSFLRLYCSVGMTLANIVECWSLLVHAMYTGLAGCRALIFKSSLSALAFTTCLHNVFWVRASRVPSTELPARSGGLTRLRLKDRKFLHTPAGTVGPLERGLIKATNSGENFEGWVVGFYGEWSDTLAKLPEKLADAQVVRWQSKYGREPTIQQRAWLVSKVRSDIAMMATKLNAQVIIKNLQNMHEKSLPPTGARRRMELAYQDWARLQGRGPRTGGPFDHPIGWRSW